MDHDTSYGALSENAWVHSSVNKTSHALHALLNSVAEYSLIAVYS